MAVNDGAPVLLHNDVGARNNWLGLKLVGKTCNPDAIGARVTWQAGDLRQTRIRTAGGSFLSAHDPRLVLGVARRSKIDWVEVRWPLPSTSVQRFTELPLNR